MNKETIKIILIAVLFSFIGVFEQSSLTIVLPKLSSVLHLEHYLVNIISISFLLFCVASGLTLGKLVSKFGMIKIGKICTVLMIFTALISTFLLDKFIILFAKSIQGVCASAFFLISYLIVVRYIEKEHMGFAIGFISAGAFLSVILAPIIGGFLSYYLPPQFVFSVTVPLSVITLILLYTLKEEWKEDVNIDYIGTLIWIISMVLFVYGISFLNRILGLICFLISFIFIALFM